MYSTEATLPHRAVHHAVSHRLQSLAAHGSASSSYSQPHTDQQLVCAATSCTLATPARGATEWCSPWRYWAWTSTSALCGCWTMRSAPRAVAGCSTPLQAWTPSLEHRTSGACRSLPTHAAHCCEQRSCKVHLAECDHRRREGLSWCSAAPTGARGCEREACECHWTERCEELLNCQHSRCQVPDRVLEVTSVQLQRAGLACLQHGVMR